MRKRLNFWSLFPVLLIILGVLLLIFRALIRKATGTTQEEEITDEDAQDVTEEDDEPEPSKEQRILNHYKIIRDVLPKTFTDDQAKILTAQAMHETGNFTSRLYKEQNNMFGMRHPILRQTKSVKEQNGFATFASLEDSVSDLLLYFDEFGIKPKDWTKVNEYVKIIKQRGYFTDDYLPYFNAVRSHYLKVKELVQ